MAKVDLKQSAKDKLIKLDKQEKPVSKLRGTRSTANYTHLNTRIPPELDKRVRFYCVEHRQSIQHFVIEVLEDRLKKDE